MPIPDPIAGELGALILAGWVNEEAPDTGREAAMLLLATSADGAFGKMSAVATFSLAFVGQGEAPADPEVRVSLERRQGRPWATLHTVGGVTQSIPTSLDWDGVARADGRVVLAVGRDPLPAGVNAWDYVEGPAGSRCLIVPLPLDS